MSSAGCVSAAACAAVLRAPAPAARFHLASSLAPRCSIAVPIHLAVSLSLARVNPAMCRTPVLQHPAMERLARRTAKALAVAARLAPPRPGTAMSALLPGTDACAFTLMFLQLTVGLAAPALLQAAAEAAAFVRHQQQRRTCGAVEERGLQARLYLWLHAFIAGLSLPAALVFALGAVSLLVQCTWLLLSTAEAA